MRRAWPVGVAGILVLAAALLIPTGIPPTGWVVQEADSSGESPPGGLSGEEQELLLGLARDSLERSLSGRGLPDVDEEALTPALREVRGCFVTLNKDSGLRGCIGHILPRAPLYRCVMQNAVSAALYDRRFVPVTYDELGDIDIDVSVLSVPQGLEFGSPRGLLDMLRPGVDGVVLEYQGRTSTYLPQVWEQLPDKQGFLSRLCLKQGSPANCWALPGVKVKTYQAFVFGE